MIALALVAVAAAGCPASALDGQLSAALGAYEQGDLAGFETAVAQVDATLVCMETPIDPELTPTLHLVQSLGAFTRRSDAGTEPVLAALRGLSAASPGYTLPDTLAPTGHPILALYDEARRTAGYAETLPLPDRTWAVDGRVGVRSIPVGRAALLQELEDDAVVAGWYLWGEGLPDALVPPPQPPAPDPVEPDAPEPLVPPPQVAAPSPRRPLAVGAAAAGGLAVAAFAVQAGTFAAWSADVPAAADPAWDRRVNLNHAMGWSAIGLGGAALALGTGALLTGTW
ncbi:MAG: hypothetical protein H6739_27505 [Alphaproteobacteria bacterium]|nr:hypothetical protein [Alphaproteobacteria bacterium]